MYITQEQLKSRLLGAEKKSNVEVITPKTKVHALKGDDKLTLEEQAIVGAIAATDGCTVASELSGLSPAVTSNYSKGITTRANGINRELKEAVDEKVDESTNRMQEKIDSAKSKAVDVLVATLSHLANGGTNISKATDASKVATDMSKIMRNLDPNKDNGNGRGNVKVLIYRPTMNDENDYVAIQVA